MVERCTASAKRLQNCYKNAQMYGSMQQGDNCGHTCSILAWDQRRCEEAGREDWRYANATARSDHEEAAAAKVHTWKSKLWSRVMDTLGDVC
jgi:hypothetical protein